MRQNIFERCWVGLLAALLLVATCVRAEYPVSKNSTSPQQMSQGKSLDLTIPSGKGTDAVLPALKEVDDLSEPPLAFQLSDAAARGDEPELTRLLAFVAPDASMTDTGMTPLMVVANARSALLLIKAGADVNRPDSRGWTSLHHAVTRSGSEELVAALLQAGADAGKRNDHGETPLLLTGLLFTEGIDPLGGPAVIDHLVADGKADINAWDQDGWTLLHQAASNDEPLLVAACLSAGANPDIRTPLQETPSEMAQRLKSTGFQRALTNYRRGKGI